MYIIASMKNDAATTITTPIHPVPNQSIHQQSKGIANYSINVNQITAILIQWNPTPMMHHSSLRQSSSIINDQIDEQYSANQRQWVEHRHPPRIALCSLPDARYHVRFVPYQCIVPLRPSCYCWVGWMRRTSRCGSMQYPLLPVMWGKRAYNWNDWPRSWVLAPYDVEARGKKKELLGDDINQYNARKVMTS